MLVRLLLLLLLCLLSLTTGNVRAGIVQSSTSTINTTSNVQVYLCASSYSELLTSHMTAQSCDTIPCPSGMFCFDYMGAITDDNNSTVNVVVNNEIILQPHHHHLYHQLCKGVGIQSPHHCGDARQLQPRCELHIGHGRLVVVLYPECIIRLLG